MGKKKIRQKKRIYSSRIIMILWMLFQTNLSDAPLMKIISLEKITLRKIQLWTSISILGVYQNYWILINPEMFCKKGTLNLQNSQENLYARVSFFNKVAGPSQLYKKKNLTQVFSCEFCKIFKSIFFIEHFLLLNQNKSLLLNLYARQNYNNL